MVLLPKGKEEYRGIGIVEVLWKVCTVVVSFCLKKSALLHDALHGFREGRGMGAVTLKATLSQHLSRFSHDPLLQVFLDVRKVYGLMYRGWCLEILMGYKLVPNLDRLLNN